MEILSISNTIKSYITPALSSSVYNSSAYKVNVTLRGFKTYFFTTRQTPITITKILQGFIGWEPVYSRFRITSVFAIDPNTTTFFTRNTLMARILP